MLYTLWARNAIPRYRCVEEHPRNRGYIEYLYDAAGVKLRKTVTWIPEMIPATFTPEVRVTDYLDGYQYVEDKLQFFPTAEGYVKNSPDSGGNHFNYVYNYTDHLGNIRLSYGYDEGDDVLKILEENNYYPFGLKHNNYNVSKNDYDEDVKGSIVPKGFLAYQYKYQGQERQDELGLGWDSFKWRNYSAELGRFMSIDPLAEKYGYQSPYNFSENRVVDCNELEGLEAVKVDPRKALIQSTSSVVESTRTQSTRTPPKIVVAPAPKPIDRNQAMLSQDTMTRAERSEYNANVKQQQAELAQLNEQMDNHENLGSPLTAKTVMIGVKDAMPLLLIPGGGVAAEIAEVAEAAEGFAIIGEGMEAVNMTKSAMLNVGFENVATFQASETALQEWGALTQGGMILSDEAVQGTKLYQQNQTWIQQMKESGRTIIDIGRDGRKVQSTFYNMERQVIYGN